MNLLRGDFGSVNEKGIQILVSSWGRVARHTSWVIRAFLVSDFQISLACPRIGSVKSRFLLARTVLYGVDVSSSYTTAHDWTLRPPLECGPLSVCICQFQSFPV
jgi:hypothetical protein